VYIYLQYFKRRQHFRELCEEGGERDKLITFLITVIKISIENKHLPNSSNNGMKRNGKKWEMGSKVCCINGLFTEEKSQHCFSVNSPFTLEFVQKS